MAHAAEGLSTVHDSAILFLRLAQRRHMAEHQSRAGDSPREMEGREASPTAGVIDSQSAKTTEAAGPHGFDAGKKINGHKRHLLVDTMGLLIAAIVHRADIQDRDGAPLLLATMRSAFPWLRHIFAEWRLRGGQAPTGPCQTRHLDLRDHPALRYRQGLRAFAATMGRRADHRLAQPQSSPRQGFRGHRRKRAGLALHRQCQAALAMPRQAVTPNAEL